MNAWVCQCFLAGLVGIWISQKLPFFVSLAMLLMGIFLVVRIMSAQFASPWKRIIIYLICWLVAVSFFASYTKVLVQKNTHLSELILEEKQVVVFLTDIEKSEDVEYYGKTVYRTRGIFRGNYQGKGFKIQLNLPGSYHLGDFIKVPTACLALPQPQKGTGQFDEQKFCLAKNILFRGYLNQALPVIGENKPQISLWFKKKRQAFFERLDQELDDQTGLVKAMVFGQTTDISEDVLTQFGQLGIRHLLAVSGMHVGVFSLILILFCALLGISSWVRFVFISSGIMVFYVVSAQAPSTLRAGLMLIIYLLLECLQVEKKPLKAWSAAGLIMLIICPFYFYDVGFRLSFAAMAGIIMFFPVLQKCWACSGWMAGLSAWLFSLPFQAVFFESTWLGIFLTPIFALFLMAVLPVVMLAFMFQSFFLCDWLLAGIYWVLRLQQYLLDWLGRFVWYEPIVNWATFSLADVSVFQIFFYYGVLIFLVVFSTKKTEDCFSLWQKTLLFVVLVLNVQLLRVIPGPQGLEVTFINVGQGDSIMVSYQDFNMLVDTGTAVSGARAVAPYLKAKAIKKIDLLVLTHPDHDHIGGAYDVFDACKVDYVCFSHSSHDLLFKEHELLMVYLEDHNIKYGFQQKGDQWQVGDVSIEVISPEAHYSNADPNLGSLMMTVQVDDFYLQLTGDEEGENLFYLDQFIAADAFYLFKAPHHGSKHALNTTVLDKLDIDVVVFSCGENNRYGHPHADVCDYFEARGIKTFRTDHQGEIKFSYKNQAVEVKKMVDYVD